jgi:hypothetical protein
MHHAATAFLCLTCGNIPVIPKVLDHQRSAGGNLMRRTLLILSLLLLVSLLFIACGERTTTVTNANANVGSNAGGVSSNSRTPGSEGIGPENQGIGGTGEGDANVVNGNTYTVPPGFNKNGDRGSATSVGNSNKP